MKSTKIPVSALISELSETPSQNIQLLIEIFKKAQENASKKQALIIEIDSDDDFSVNGKSQFRGEYIIENSISETFKNAIASINFGSDYLSGNSKFDYFIEGVRSKYVLDSINNGHVSFGGNQTLDAYIKEPTDTLYFGDLEIDLKS